MATDAERRRLRRKVVAEWRGAGEPRETGHHLRTTGELMPAVIGRLGVAERFAQEKLTSAWHEIVGDFLARQSHPVRLERGVLVVAVLQPAVLFTLERDLKPRIVARLREIFGTRTIRSVRFVHG